MNNKAKVGKGPAPYWLIGEEHGVRNCLVYQLSHVEEIIPEVITEYDTKRLLGEPLLEYLKAQHDELEL